MKAFVTGSHAYGTPREDSDIDLVVLMPVDDLLKLSKFDPEFHGEQYGVMASGFLRFGKLNLLAVTNEVDYNVWLEGTLELIARRPVTRDEAVAVFKRRQAEARPRRTIPDDFDDFGAAFDWP